MMFLRVRRLCVLSTRPHDKRLVGSIPTELSIRTTDSLAADYPEAVFHKRLLPGKKRDDIFPYDTPTVALLVLVRAMGVATDPDITGRNGSYRIYHL
jgi:hypothetical protein